MQQNQEKSEQKKKKKAFGSQKTQRVNLKHLIWRRFYSTFFSRCMKKKEKKKEASKTIHINSTLLGAGNPSLLCGGMEKIKYKKKKTQPA